MLRTGIATLMVCVIGATDVSADETAAQNRGTLMGWLTSGQRSRPVAVCDSTQQVTHTRQISNTLVADQPQPGTVPSNPLPIQIAPVIPNQSPVSGPQYFTVSNTQEIAQSVHPGRNWQQYQTPQPVYRNSPGVYNTVSHRVAQPTQPVYRNSPGVYSTVSHRLAPAPVTSSGGKTSGASKSGAPLNPGTALYPAPVPGIPRQMGGTTVSNQFLNPHEMLYAHRYRAMYPPYSYKVNGKWMVTPFGVWSHEDWHLQGTKVDVKYKSSISPFALFHRPLGR